MIRRVKLASDQVVVKMDDHFISRTGIFDGSGYRFEATTGRTYKTAYEQELDKPADDKPVLEALRQVIDVLGLSGYEDTTRVEKRTLPQETFSSRIRRLGGGYIPAEYEDHETEVTVTSIGVERFRDDLAAAVGAVKSQASRKRLRSSLK